ncbi:MAG: prephenate dehydrogenase [Myxococcota bacterium]
MSALPLFDRLAVVGLGLMGGSVALAARARGLARELRGVDPALREAAGIPLVELREAAGWADGLVLAVPLDALDSVVRTLAERLSPSALVTDTASVKQPMAEAARAHLPSPELCIGAHPMAGGDMSGFAHAREDLFEGAPCILTLEGHEPAAAVDRVERFWQGLGTRTVRRTPREHDAITALLSHAPHVIAFAFAEGLPDAETLRLAGPGLRDFLRIARGSPRLWSDILLRNRRQIAENIAQFEKNLGSILNALASGDRRELEVLLARARSAVEKLER